jgi:uncharacterized membrane protein (UPF0182 family)
MIENESNQPSGFKLFCLNLLHWQVFVPALLFLIPLWYGLLQPMTEWYFEAILAFGAFYFSGWALLIIFAGIGFIVSIKRYWLPFILLLYAPVSLFIGAIIQDKFPSLIFCIVILIPVTMLIAIVLIANLAKKRKDGGYNFIAKTAMCLFLIFLLSLPPCFIGSHLFSKYSEQFKQKAQGVIEKIDAYYTANHKYPETLKEIGYESETPMIYNEPEVLLNYYSSEDYYRVDLSKPRIFLGRWSYDSSTKKWVFDG